MQIDYLALAQSLGIDGRQTMTGELYACCPLHDERNPSFSINLRTGLWFCHAEQRGGTFEQLVMEVSDYSYRQAVRWIYSAAMLDPDLSGMPTTEPIQEEDRLESELKHYHALPERRMSRYWLNRLYTIDQAVRWGVRYDLHSRELWIPYRWPFNGPIIGFIRRTTVPDQHPKYRNTPGLPRNEYLFGYGNLGIEKSPSVVIVTEGPFDAFRADQFGYHVAAILGTYMSKQQARQISKMRHDVVLAFDAGEEGRKATESASTLLPKYGILPRVLRFPDGEERDLDDLTHAEFQLLLRAAAFA